MESLDLQLKNVDIAQAVAYFGETELLDFIGASRIEDYLVSAQEDANGVDDGKEPWAKVHLHRHITSAKVQLGGRCKMTIQADFADNDSDEVIIDVRMDRAFGVLLRQRTPDVA